MTTSQLNKRQRMQHEDLQYYFEYMTNLQRKMSLSMLEMNYNGFVNESRPALDPNKYADVILRIFFEDDKFFDLPSHRIILAMKSAYFESLFNYQKQQCNTMFMPPNEERLEEQTAVIPLHTSMSSSEECSVREFFRLFYIPVFEDSHLSTEQHESIVSNVLVIHQMAEQFLFHTLRKYCRHKIYERFDLNLFSLLFNQSLVRHSLTENKYHIIKERASFFKRLLAWFVCCAEIHSSNLPFIELDQGVSLTSPVINPLTQQPNSLIPPPQERNGEETKKKRKRPSVSSDKKLELLNHMRQVIVDFDQYDTFSFKLEHDLSSKTTRIRSFGRLCEACVHNKSNVHIARINQIVPGEQETRRTWHIYLDLNANTTQSSGLYVQVNHYANKENSIRLSPQPLMQCQSRITILSKLYKNKPQVALPVLSSLESFTNMQPFIINEPQFCYHGQCDVCHAAQSRLFIVKYEIDASFL